MARRLSQEELSEIRESFNLFDQDGDGYITIEELGSVVRSIGRKVTERDLKKMIKECDSDKNGRIDFDEFIQLMSKHLRAEDYEDNMRSAFRVFDCDGNGYITRLELKQAMNKLDPSLTEDEIDEMLAEADANKDGKINYQEFVNIINSK